MFGDLLGNLEQKQKEMKAKLAEIFVDAESGDGAVKVTANANREITNISIDPQKIDLNDTEALEDFVLVATNRALQLAADKEAAESQNLMKDMLPPGMGDLPNMFG